MPFDIIRAWKDEDYRSSLSNEQRALLPESPAGFTELSDEDLGSAVGGLAPCSCCCSCYSSCPCGCCG